MGRRKKSSNIDQSKSALRRRGPSRMEEKGLLHPKTKLNGYSTLKNEDQETHRPVATPLASQAPFLVELTQGILGNPYLRINLYLVGVLLFSLLGPHIEEYQSYVYTAQPHNIFNDYFVKFGWGWTIGLISPVALLTGIAYNGATGAFWSSSRLLVATGVWFGCTRLFDEIRTRLSPSLDISGHSFILIWSVMVLVEEGGAYAGWDELRSNLARNPPSETKRLNTTFFLKHFTFVVRIFLVLSACLSVLWDVMFFSTILFFHTWTEKLIATALAIFVWLVLYQGIYTLPIRSLLPRHQATQAYHRLLY